MIIKPPFCPGVYGSALPVLLPPGLRIEALDCCLRLQVSSLALAGINSTGGWGAKSPGEAADGPDRPPPGRARHPLGPHVARSAA